jgi:hypothetical protein
MKETKTEWQRMLLPVCSKWRLLLPMIIAMEHIDVIASYFVTEGTTIRSGV